VGVGAAVGVGVGVGVGVDVAAADVHEANATDSISRPMTGIEWCFTSIPLVVWGGELAPLAGS
jgi:hypothetical protein